MRRSLIVGGPGTGKTTRLLELLTLAVDSGIPPESIAFVSFTKKAVTEAKQRAAKQLNIELRRLPLFKTLHALCFTTIGATRRDVIGKTDLAHLGTLLGTKLTGYIGPDDDINGGDRMLFLDNLARSTFQDLDVVWHTHGLDDVSWPILQRFSTTYRLYKESKGKLDFTDMLLQYSGQVPARIAFIDEAQDLSPAQWAVVDEAFAGCERIYYAGDDDQAIYTWAGADVERFLKLNVDSLETLPVSWRLPQNIFNFACGISSKITERYKKKWRPYEAGGEVHITRSEALRINDTNESWLMLARNRCFLNIFEQLCIQQGISYTTRFGPSVDPDDVTAAKAYEALRRGPCILTDDEIELVAKKMNLRTPPTSAVKLRESIVASGSEVWHNAFGGVPINKLAYYLTILRRGGKLTIPPKVHIDTIHSVKGGEADNVAIAMDITKKTETNMLRRPNDELRVLYVGATRARYKLHILLPKTTRFFDYRV